MSASGDNLGNIVEVQNENGENKYYYTLLPHEEMFEKGLISIAIAGVFTKPIKDSEAIDFSSFKPNSVYISFMHKVIEENAPKSQSFRDEVKRQKNGVVVVIDYRVKNKDNGVPSEDIVGLFEIKNSLMTSYKANPNYVLWSEKGFSDLGPELQPILLSEIRNGYK